MKNKITLKEFFESKEELAIHCDTEEKTNKLLKEFDKLGKKLSNGTSYLENNQYEHFGKNTVYYNSYQYGSKQFAEKTNHKIYSFEDMIFEEYKPKNLIPEIAKMLGVEIGEEFILRGQGHTKHKLDLEKGLMFCDEDLGIWFRTSKGWNDLLSNPNTIEKLPKKPQLSEQEYWVLKGLKDYKYLIRDIVGDMNVQKNVSENTYDDWDYMCPYNHLFKFVKKGQKPHNIQKLLEEYEKLKESSDERNSI